MENKNEQLPTFSALEEALEIFNDKFKRPNMVVELITPPLDLETDYRELENIENELHVKYGVYIFLNQNREVIRIGSAINNMYDRLNTYFDYKSDSSGEGRGWWKEGVSTRYIYLINVDEDQIFEALAIEKYLLDKLQPPLNKEGKKKYSGYRQEMRPELEKLAKDYGWNPVPDSWYENL